MIGTVQCVAGGIINGCLVVVHSFFPARRYIIESCTTKAEFGSDDDSRRQPGLFRRRQQLQPTPASLLSRRRRVNNSYTAATPARLRRREENGMRRWATRMTMSWAIRRQDNGIRRRRREEIGTAEPIRWHETMAHGTAELMKERMDDQFHRKWVINSIDCEMHRTRSKEILRTPSSFGLQYIFLKQKTTLNRKTVFGKTWQLSDDNNESFLPTMTIANQAADMNHQTTKEKILRIPSSFGLQYIFSISGI